MKKEIFALLTAKFSGVRKDGLEHLARVLTLQTTTEEEAAALVEKLTETQVCDFVKEYRSDVDRETTSARKTIEENLKKKYGIIKGIRLGEPANMAIDVVKSANVSGFESAPVSITISQEPNVHQLFVNIRVDRNIQN